MFKKISVFIEKILKIKQPKQRLGNGEEDAQQIKKHPFFSSINWKEVNELKCVPPFKPKIEGKDDLRHFDKV